MMPLHAIDEKELLLRLRQGDHAAFRQLYGHYAPSVFARIKRLVHRAEWTEELHQDVFMRIWEQRHRLAADTPFQAIVMRTAKSVAVDFYRKAIRDRQLQEQLLAVATEDYDPLDTDAFDEGTHEALRAAIAKLPEQRQQVFTLVKLEGKSYQEAADELGIALSTVKDHMAKAMAFLRAELTQRQRTLLLIGLLSQLHAAFS